MKIDLSKCVICISDEEEFSDENYIKSNKLTILKTGVGKVNASMKLSYYLKNNNPEYIINLGSCGSIDFKVGDIVNPIKFIQADIDVTKFGYKKYQTPKEENIFVETKEFIIELPHPICKTADKFEDNMKRDSLFENDKIIFDMEAYSLVKTANLYNKNFIAIKYITDSGDSNDQNKNVKNCTESFKEFLNKIKI